MNFKEKYLKYKNKYLKNKLYQQGGENTQIIYYDNLDFLKDWDMIDNSGQQNCGIYISDIKKDRIIKCGGTDKLYQLHKEGKLYSEFNLFPIIYNIYKPKLDEGNTYIEMQRLDGDVTDLLYKVLAENVLNSMNIEKKDKDAIWYIYRGMMPYTMNNKESLYIYFSQGEEYLFKNLEEMNSYIEKYNEALNKYNQAKEDKYKFTEFDFKNHNFSIYNEPNIIINKFEKLTEIQEKLQNVTLKYEIYENFIKLLETNIKQYIPIIRDMIINLKLYLLHKGYYYDDDKLDNYGYILSDNKLSYLDNKLINNEFEGKYLYIYFLDWDSGLSMENNMRDKIRNLEHLVSDYNTNLSNYSKYGQYKIKSIGNKVLHIKENIINLPSDIFKILITNYESNIL